MTAQRKEALASLLRDAAGWCRSAGDDPLLKALARAQANRDAKRCDKAAELLEAT